MKFYTMKKQNITFNFAQLSVLVFLAISAFNSTAQNASSTLINAGFVVAQQVTVDQTALVSGIEMEIANLDAGKVQVAIYSDENGAVGQLQTATITSQLEYGLNELSLENTKQFEAGKYWIVFSFEKSTQVYSNKTAKNVANYTFHSFGNELPANFKGASYDLNKCNVELKKANGLGSR